ncbi:hypothetical protein K1T71_004531 [Dendrolimus kikuchii]|uniref:Uncharacterized protein n=1 Tax=Dendrolimus kikuchii TaxID=765133 RepID=A0ACC1D7U6_9NEOP|nr:hypothetical protein K1T71_004531 [Dendrolimus kikuchii]
MKKSIEKLSSSKSSTELESLFSNKRYFLNNLDSYNGQYLLKELSKVLEKNVESTKQTSQTVVGEDVEMSPPPLPEQSHEIIGTVSDTKVKSLDCVARIIPKSESLPQLLTCGNVILDISCDREELGNAMEYMKLAREALTNSADVIEFCSRELFFEGPGGGIVSLFQVRGTWSLTSPRCSPGWISLALVLASGVTYGGPEDVLFYWFQKAWECERLLPILGRGGNVVPLINVLDLAQIVYNLISDFPKKLYILAVEQNVTKQREIIKPLGRIVGSGMFKCIPQEDAFLIPELNQRIYDLMTLNLNMEPTFIVETMGLQWTSELTFAENVSTLMKQFKKERGLKSFKVVIYGPPLVGKKTLAKMICEAYGLVYVAPDTIVQDLIDDLVWRVKHWEVGETAALGMPTGEEEDPAIVDDDDTGEEEGAQESARQTLAILQSGRAFNEEEIIGYLRQRLLSREALNRGWVLVGFPNSLAQCTALFDKGEEQDSEAGEEADEEPFDEDTDLYSNVLKKMLPDIVVYLDATDDFICEKAMRQPEGDARLDEEAVLKSLSEFRAGDTRELTPLNFFDEIDIHPLVVPVKDHLDYSMKGPYAAVALRMGRPCRYGKLLALIEAAEKKEKEELETLRVKEAKALKELEKKIQEEREEKMEYWSELYALLREEEEAALAAAGEPMRNYLVHHIFPTLTPALLEVAKLRPNDPIDFLAEYLFKLNPNGKMLEPGYNLQAEMLMGKIKILDDALKDLDIKIDPLIPPEADIPSVSKRNFDSMNAL